MKIFNTLLFLFGLALPAQVFSVPFGRQDFSSEPDPTVQWVDPFQNQIAPSCYLDKPLALSPLSLSECQGDQRQKQEEEPETEKEVEERSE